VSGKIPASKKEASNVKASS